MKTAVFTFGRMQPPTKGHQKLVDAIKMEAGKRKATPLVFLSHTFDRKKNPLEYRLKIKYAQDSFGPVVKSAGAKTIIDVMQFLQKQGYESVIMVVGSDRVVSMKHILTTYNGADFTFKSVEVLSSGDRDPDADGIVGISSTKVREYAMKGDLDNFKDNVPSMLSSTEANRMFKDIRTSMGITNKVIKGGAKQTIGDGRQLWAVTYDIPNVSTGVEVIVGTRVSPDSSENDAKILLKKKIRNATNIKVIKNMGINEEISITRSDLDAFVDTYELEAMDKIDISMFEEEEVAIADIKEALTVAQRLVRKRLLKRIGPKLKRRKELLKTKMATPERLKKRSRKAAIQLIRSKFAGTAGKNYATLSSSQKINVDKIIQRKMSSVTQIAKRLLPRIRKKEQERLASARGAKNEK